MRTVNADGRVEFHHVQIVRDDVDGVWVAGLPDITTIITVGQELVVPGEIVDVDFEPADEMPATAPPSNETTGDDPGDLTVTPPTGSAPGITLAAHP